MNNENKKYQYSVFTKVAGDGQFVFRTDDKTEFELMLSNIKDFVNLLGAGTSKDVAKPDGLRVSSCSRCGEPATVRSGEKNGKVWQGVFCSSKNSSHTQWL